MFLTIHFATVREREGRDCLVAKTVYFNITKLLRPCNIANDAQNPFKLTKFAILSRRGHQVNRSQLSKVDLHLLGFKRSFDLQQSYNISTHRPLINVTAHLITSNQPQCLYLNVTLHHIAI